MKLRTKITSTYIALTVVGVITVSLVSSWQIKKYVDQRTAENLFAQLDLLTQLFTRQELAVDPEGTHDQDLRNIARILGIRLTVIRQDGVVTFDSEVPRDSLVHLENHLSRPELQRARHGGLGVDRRRSASVDQEFLYAAKITAFTLQGQSDSAYVRAALRVTDISRVDNQVQAIIWAVGLLTMAVTVLVSFQISRRITRPILAIAGAAQEIKGGNLARRSEVVSNDEIGRLSLAINDMADILGKDITRLKKLEQVRSEFLANVSHELRTPIFSIQGFLETLLDGAVDDPAVNRDFLEKAHKHTERLNALLNDLIEISRIESGEMKMSFRFFGVTDFLRQAVDEFSAQAAARGISLRLDMAGAESVSVYGDRDRLHQVMANLIDNAVKYTQPGGNIVCRAVPRGNSYEIRVEDTGCGIAAEHLPRIFERFYRVDRDRSREVGGTGLGLAIVKHIVEAHGGTVRVESIPGKGSVFSFELKRDR